MYRTRKKGHEEAQHMRFYSTLTSKRTISNNVGVVFRVFLSVLYSKNAPV